MLHQFLTLLFNLEVNPNGWREDERAVVEESPPQKLHSTPFTPTPQLPPPFSGLGDHITISPYFLDEHQVFNA